MICTKCGTLDPLMLESLCPGCDPADTPVCDGPERAAIRAKGLAATDDDVRAYHLLGRPARDLSLAESVWLTSWRDFSEPLPEPTRYESGTHVGVVDTRVTIRVKVSRVTELEPNDYGRRFLCRMVEAETCGDVVWFTGENLTLKEGDEATVRATVKDHGAYNGVRQTKVDRLKVTEWHNRVEEPGVSGGIDWDTEGET